MKHLFLKTFFISLLALTLCSFTDTWKNITKEEAAVALKKVSEFYIQNQQFSVQLSHTSYADYNAVSAYEKMSGFFKKDHDSYYSLMMGIKTVQNNVIKLSMDTNSKVILVDHAEKNSSLNFGIKETEDAFAQCTSFKMRALGDEAEYKFEYPSSFKVAASVIRMDADGKISKIILYFAKQQHTNENDQTTIIQPRAEIDYWGFKKGKVDASEFDVNKYVRLVKGKYMPSEKYKDFTVRDLRIK